MPYHQFVGAFLPEDQKRHVIDRVLVQLCLRGLEPHDVIQCKHVTLASKIEPWEAKEAESEDKAYFTFNELYLNDYIQTIPVNVMYPHRKKRTHLTFAIRSVGTHPHFTAENAPNWPPDKLSCRPSYSNHVIKVIEDHRLHNARLPDCYRAIQFPLEEAWGVTGTHVGKEDKPLPYYC